MDRQRLSELTIRAIGFMLHYLGIELLPEHVALTIRREIDELFHLRFGAQDPSVADLEIACDAATSFAEAYNSVCQEEPRINVRWFYHCIQSLLLVELLPASLDGEVDRLPRKDRLPSRPFFISPDEIKKSAQSASSSTPGPNTAEPPPERSMQSSKDTKPAAPARAAKAKWEHGEIQRMVELKASGMRHCDIATKLGRGQGSVENKYGRVMHTDEWKDYSTSFEAGLRQKDRDAEDDGSQRSSP